MTHTTTVLVLGLGTILGMMFLVWILSLIKKDAGIIDPFWGLGFVVLAWFYFMTSDSHTRRQWLVVALVTFWGVRLSAHLFRRNLGKDEDYRYREMREASPGAFALRSLFIVFFLQAAILWVVSFPLFQALRTTFPESITLFDAAGALLFSIGLFFEAVGDWQLSRFRSNPASQGKVLDHGLWRYTRHPNYFGDALVWWGFFLIALATPRSAWTVVSPVLMTFLLMKVSGVVLLEKKLGETKPAYRDYVRRTSAFFPRPPKRQ
jgi:steroid 5-alpha reductase family enzyme